MKAGTTTLHVLLDSHPEIFMSDPKEPTFFVDGAELEDVSRRAWEAGYWRDRERYLQLFSGAARASVRGESSTAYSKLSRLTGVAQRIAAQAPDARILYILRDPVERTLSHYLHAVQWNDEARRPLDAIRSDPHYREVSHYAMQLKPYHAVFGRDRVLVITLESLTMDPVRSIQGVYAWLGVDAKHVPPETERQNVTRANISRARGPETLRRVRSSPYVGRVKEGVPWRLRQLLRRVLDERLHRQSSQMAGVVDYLRPRQREETEELSRILDRPFPEWKTLNP
jgi:hypothetical protein